MMMTMMMMMKIMMMMSGSVSFKRYRTWNHARCLAGGFMNQIGLQLLLIHYCWPALIAIYAMLPMSVRPSYVRCPSHGHTSKTKQDRPTVRPTTEHCVKLAPLIPVAAFRSHQMPPVEILWFQIKIYSNINIVSCSTLSPDYSCCHQSATESSVDVKDRGPLV